MIVHAGLIDDGADTESFARIGLGCKFPPKPADCRRLQFFIASFVTLPIPADDLCEVEAARQLLEMGKTLANDLIGRFFVALSIVLSLADKSFDYGR